MKPRSLLVDVIHTLLGATVFALLFGGMGWALVGLANVIIRTPGLTIFGGLIGFVGAVFGFIGIAFQLLGAWGMIAMPLQMWHVRFEFAVTTKWWLFNGWWDGPRQWGFAIDVLRLQLSLSTIEGR